MSGEPPRKVATRQGSRLNGILADEAYVFYRSPSFGGSSEFIAIRCGNWRALVAEVLSVDTYWDRERVLRELSSEEWEQLASVAAGIGFWEMPEHEPQDRIMLDGERWTAEGLREGVLWRVERHVYTEQLRPVADVFYALVGRDLWDRDRPRPAKQGLPGAAGVPPLPADATAEDLLAQFDRPSRLH